MHLTNDELTRDIRRVFSTGIMTVISVVLGVTIYFVLDALQEFSNPECGVECGGDKPLRLAQALFVLLLVPGMFQMYHYICCLVFTPPLFVTSFPIFAVGISLAGLASSIKSAPLDIFLLWLTVFFASCALAFRLTLRMVKWPTYEMDDLKRRVKKNSARLHCLYACLAVASAVYYLSRNFEMRWGTDFIDWATATFDKYWDVSIALGVIVIFLVWGVAQTARELLAPMYFKLFPKWEPIWSPWLTIAQAGNSALRSPRNAPSDESS